MQNTRNKHNFTKKELVKAWGSFLFVLAALFLVAPLGVVFPLGSWIFLVFGHLGFYFFNVLLLAISLVLIIKGSLIKDYFSWIQILGYFVMMLGFMTFTSATQFKGMDLAGVNTALLANWENSVSYYVSPSIGGGYIGFALYSLLKLGTDAVAYVLAVTFIVLGIVLLLLEPIKMLISFLAGTISHNAAIASSKKAIKKFELEVEASKEDEIEMPESPIKHVYADATETRIERYSEPDTAEIVVPVTPRYNQESPGTSSGLHEAHFGEETSFQESLLSPNPAPYDFSSSPFDESFSSTPALAPAEEEPLPTPVQQQASFEESSPFIDDPLLEEPEIIAPTPIASSPAPAPQAAPAPTPQEAPAPAPAPAYQETVRQEPVQQAPTYAAPAPAPAPVETYAAPAPAPAAPAFAPTPEPTLVETNEFKDPNVTLADKREALISTFDPEKQIIIRQLHADMYEELPPYTLPGLDLLDEPKGGADPVSIQADCEFKKSLIDQLFVDMRVGAHVESYVVGPSVTRFNIAKDPNVRVGQIEGVISDLSIRLNGTATRFQAVVQGQSTSGLEIPNDKSTMVTLKEMLQSIPEGNKYKFHIPFGKDVTGQYVTGDIRKFPHMLIAGSTGSGKSIFIHSILMALIMKNRPEELKLILVDPKRVEMALYKDLPHLLCPIIKDVTQVKVCLDKLIDEMERRNTIFEHAGVTNIAQYNDIYAPAENMAKLPYIVLVLDEFADAVDVCKNISEPVARLAQKARSAGIHIILTTQRPTTDVVNGRIKANLPTTVALWVRTATDSVVILGEGGAEGLAGHGDMLINCPEINKYTLIRAQGCYVDPQETTRVCSFIKQQQKTHYDPVFLDLVDHEAEQKAFEAAAAAAAPSRAEVKAGEAASKYELIREAVMGMEYVSISKIQREFSVGFPRAGKIMKQLVDEGIVAGTEPGQETNSKGSKVLIHSLQTLSGENEGTTEGVKVVPAGWDMPK